MPLLYKDSVQSDIDLCHVLWAIFLDDPVDDNPLALPLHPAPTSVVVDDNNYYPLLDQDPRHWVEISQPTSVTDDSTNTSPGDRTMQDSTLLLPSPVTSGTNVLDIAASQTISRTHAGHVTSQDPNGHTRRMASDLLSSPAPFECKSYLTYAVFEGLLSGIYDTWYV